MTTTEEPTTDRPASPVTAPAESTAPEPQAAADALPKPARSSRRRKPRGTSGTATSPATKPRTRAAGKRRTRVDITKGLTSWYVTAGTAVSVIPSPRAAEPMNGTVAQVIGLNMASNAQECAQAWAQLADENPAVREVLERVLTVSAIAAVITAHMPILAAAGIATGVVPPQAGAIIAALMSEDSPAPAPAPEAPAAAGPAAE